MTLHRVIPGGQHADGLTSNALVSLADGVYIELIAFNKPATEYPPDSPRSKHWWANKEPGWIDWACLGLEDHVDQTIAEREKQVGSGVAYQKGKLGGRKRAGDGQELKWRVTFPETKHGRGTMPFFCQDLTPRELRVRYLVSLYFLLYSALIHWQVPDADINTHSNSALGISHIHLSVPEENISQVRAQLSVVLDVKPTAADEWELSVPHSGQELPAPRLKLAPASPDITVSSIELIGFYVRDFKDEVGTPKGFGKVTFVQA